MKLAPGILIRTFIIIGLAHLALPKSAQSLVSKAHIISRSALFDYGQRKEKYHRGYEYQNLKLQNSVHNRLTNKFKRAISLIPEIIYVQYKSPNLTLFILILSLRRCFLLSFCLSLFCLRCLSRCFPATLAGCWPTHGCCCHLSGLFEYGACD
jgi:hypothetical protein